MILLGVELFFFVLFVGGRLVLRCLLMCEVTRGANVCQQEGGPGLFRDFVDLSTCS